MITKEIGYLLMGVNNFQIFFDNKLVAVTIEQFEGLKSSYEKLYGTGYIIQQGDTITLLPTKDIRQTQVTLKYLTEDAMAAIEQVSRTVGNYEKQIKDSLKKASKK